MNELLVSELGRTGVFHGSRREAEEAGIRYVIPVVGLTRSRGVGGVKPVEDTEVHSKGLAIYCKERYENDAIHRNG